MLMINPGNPVIFATDAFNSTLAFNTCVPSSANASNNRYDAVNHHWSFPSIGQLVFTVLTLLTNLFVLHLFIRYPHLRTPFTVYLINLLLANLVHCLANPLRIVDVLAIPWYAQSAWCYVQMYSDWVSTAVTLHAHFLVTVNRIWALFAPVSYKNHHSKRFAKLTCLFQWIYAHLLPGPLLILDGLFYHRTLEASLGCVPHIMGTQLVYAQVLEVLVYVLPVIVIVVCYPFLCWKRNKYRVRQLQLAVNQVPMSDMKKVLENTYNSMLTGNSLVAPCKAERDHSYGFAVLTAMTVSIVVCWTPSKVYGMIQTFGHVELTGLSHVGDVLYALQAILDPLLFACSLRMLRRAAVDSLRCK
ncbi:mu-type opioid receptor-like [Paramacrobiotus metropolitanus]|uniref:mu-type opioid receptor-like n=1 Tax=Paramacrobiotus metropolitanus TaxID=2943436 RepID=UPI0024457FF7|nr:mu-type opioid receptor-like [Paramacrobiotus metropolitanus]